MATKCEWIYGVQLGVDGFLHMPFSPPRQAREAYGYFDHFVTGPCDSSTTAAGFAVTVLTSGTLGLATGSGAAGGWLNLNATGGDGQGIQMQGPEAFLPAATKDIWMETKIKLTDADDADWFAGLAAIDTNVFSTDPTEIIAFRGDDGDLNLDFQVRNGGSGSQADTGVDMADATAVRLGFKVSGATSVVPYINGTAYTAVTTNIPTGELALTFGILRGATTATNILAIDYVAVCQLV